MVQVLEGVQLFDSQLTRLGQPQRRLLAALTRPTVDSVDGLTGKLGDRAGYLLRPVLVQRDVERALDAPLFVKVG
jgi:hypothetical protein